MSLVMVVSEKRRRQCAKLVELSKAVVLEAFDMFSPGEIGLVWTGGKDSSLTLWCVRQVCAEKNIDLPKVLRIDRGDEFREIEEFTETYADKWNIPLQLCRNEDVLLAADHVLGSTVKIRDLDERNRKELERIGFKEAEFVFDPDSYAGHHLMKTVVLNQWLEENGIRALFEGRRWDEHPERFDDNYFDFFQNAYMVPEHTRVRPILHFTERDVWTSHAAFQIPYCPLYEQGYRSLGTRASTFKLTDTPAWKQDLDNTEERSGRWQDKEKSTDRLTWLHVGGRP